MVSKNSKKILASYGEYICDENDRQIYEKSKRLASFVDTPGLLAAFGVIISFFYFLAKILSYPSALLANKVRILGFLQTEPASLSEFVVAGGLLGLSLFAIVLFARLEAKFQGKAYSSGINQQRYRLDILARGISALRNEEYQEAVSQLKEFKELDHHFISQSMII